MKDLAFVIHFGADLKMVDNAETGNLDRAKLFLLALLLRNIHLILIDLILGRVPSRNVLLELYVKLVRRSVSTKSG